MKKNLTSLQSERIGTRCENWKIIDCIPRKSKKGCTKYVAECCCGARRISSLYKLRSRSKCKICRNDEQFKKNIGKQVNNIKILGFTRKDGRPFFSVKCRCSREFDLETNNIKSIESLGGCSSCRDGIYPGQIIDGWEIVENLENAFHRMRCTECRTTTDYKFRHSRKKVCECKKGKIYLEAALKKVGLKYKHLTVHRLVGNKNGHYIFEMRCICGKKFLRENGHVFKSQSCGCRRSENIPLGEDASNATFTNIEITSMRELYDSKSYTFDDICEMFKEVKPHYIRRILKRKIWKNLT